jgi:hypothetical protein
MNSDTTKGTQTMKTITTMDGIRPGHDELVPSRYALGVGEIDVLVISDGVVTPPAESMATNADPAVRASWLDDMFLSREAFDWGLNAVVVRSGSQTILIDSGLGAEVPDFRRAGQLVHRLEAAGIDLASVTDIVLTHMHFDHVGGLLVDGVKNRLRPELRSTWQPPRPSSGRRPISPAPAWGRRSRTWLGGRPSGS